MSPTRTRGARQTPALPIDGRVRPTGRIASAQEISGWLAGAAQETHR